MASNRNGQSFKDKVLSEHALRAKLPIGLILITTAALLTFKAMAASGDRTAVVWGSYALTVYCAGLLVITADLPGRYGLGLAQWKIGPWSLAWCALASGLATATWSKPQTGTSAQITISSILRALWLIAIAMTAWTAGYRIGPHKIAAHVATRVTGALTSRYTSSLRSPAVPWTLYLIGTTARVITAILTGRFGYVGDAASAVSSAAGYTQALSMASTFAPLAIVAAAYRAFQGRTPSARVTLMILFTAEIASGALAGGKQSFVVAILAVAMPAAASGRKIPGIAMTFATLFFLLAIIPFNQAYREIARGNQALSAGQAISTAPRILQQVASADSSPSVIFQSVTYLEQRVREIDSPAVVMQRTPSQVPYESAVLIAEDPAAQLIPRILWPGKPIIAPGYQFSQQYYGLPRSALTSSAITPTGYLYQHGGWWPVIAGMFLFGSAVRALDDIIDPSINIQFAFLAVLLLPELVKAENDFATIVASLPAAILTWAVVVSVSFARRPSGVGARQSPEPNMVILPTS